MVQLRRVEPGKRPLTAQVTAAEAAPSNTSAYSADAAPVQRKMVGPGYGSPIPPADELRTGSVGDRADANQIAAAGVDGPGQVLPHADSIQRSFGSHDVGGTRAHVGGDAAGAADALGAEAFATGNDVAFRASPDLHTAAHEAAHVVQQRGGVELKGGLGPADHAAEAHADAVADRVVAGESAQDLLDAAPTLGRVALKKGKKADGDEVDDGEGESEGAAADEKVTVTVKWGGVFGADLSAKVALKGRNGKKGTWTAIETKDVVDPDGAEGDKAQRLEETFEVARFRYYQATVKPTDDVKGDDQDVGRYRSTTFTSGAVGKEDTEALVKGLLEVNRWNKDNVAQRHQEKNLDPKKAKDVSSYPLFGRSVQVNKLLATRVQDTNRRYEEGTTPEEKAEIAGSIFVMGGYAYRTQTGKAGNFSDHSIGTAIDVNYNEGMKQNALMEDANERALLNDLVQPVVRTDSSHEDFKIWEAKGQEQLEASRVFNERFPRYLAELMGRDDDVSVLDATATEVERAAAAKALFDKIGPADVKASAAKQTDAAKKARLELIAKNWDALKAWLFGAKVVDKHPGQKDPKTGKKLAKENKTAVGMIPLHSKVLEIFLAAGWDWGGDWTRGTRKDYMHFQDESIVEQLELDEGEGGKATE